MKFGDRIVRDPFVRPIPIELPHGSQLKTILDQLVPVEKRKEHVLVGNEASAPMNVIGSKVVPGCVVCGGDLWLAPSGQLYLSENPGAVALICIEHILTALKEP